MYEKIIIQEIRLSADTVKFFRTLENVIAAGYGYRGPELVIEAVLLEEIELLSCFENPCIAFFVSKKDLSAIDPGGSPAGGSPVDLFPVYFISRECIYTGHFAATGADQV